MNKLTNIFRFVILCGVLVELIYVFWFLFDELNKGHFLGKVSGITFAFASIWFVTKANKTWIKITIIALDICTILYYYLHGLLEIRIEYIAVIVALYIGFIIFFLGSTMSSQIDNESATILLREMQNRQRIAEIESDMLKTERRIRQSKTETTKQKHVSNLENLKSELEQLKTN